METSIAQGLYPHPKQYPSMFKVKVTDRIDEEYIYVIDDIVRLVIVQLIVQTMFYMNSPEQFQFTWMFFATLLYIIIGVSFYWLVVRKLIVFV